MKGHILFTSYEEIDNEDLSNYEIKLQIIRSINKGLKKDFQHKPALSPSLALLNKTMYKWKKLIFNNEERQLLRIGKTKTWFDLYEIAFLKEKRVDTEFINALNQVKKDLDLGKNIVAICYCEDFDKCHRKLIAKMLSNEGYTVILK